MNNLISKGQVRRFFTIARSTTHRFRPWSGSEINKFLKHHGCIDLDGKPDATRILVYKNYKPFYEELCKLVAGPVPDYALDEINVTDYIPPAVGHQLKLNSQLEH